MSRLLALIGPPGSGKTTQLRMLDAHFGSARVLLASVPRLVRGSSELRALLTEEEQLELDGLEQQSTEARTLGVLAPLRNDELLFLAIGRSHGRALTVMDGCPRGQAQARLFLQQRDLAHRVHVVNLEFPDHTEARSIARQHAREVLARGERAAQERIPRFINKARVYTEDTCRGLQLLEAAGIQVTRICALDNPADVHAQIMNTLGSERSAALTTPVSANALEIGA